MGTLQTSRTAAASFACALGLTHLLCRVASNPLKPAQFPTSLHIYRKSDALRIASSCKLPKQLWETNRHLTFPHQHTNKERTLLPMAASAALRRQTHALFKTCHVTACTTTYAACSTEYMHGKNLCCVASPQPHANGMLFNVPDGLGVLSYCVSPYCFPQSIAQRPTTCSASSNASCD